MIGKTLTHYRILDKLGEGGMGVVWKALDTQLDREVAVKILPEHLANDAEHLARFEREAKLLASLNHRNIAAIYGVGSDTVDEGSPVRFIVMELVEGEDLSTRLARGQAFGKYVNEKLNGHHTVTVVPECGTTR